MEHGATTIVILRIGIKQSYGAIIQSILDKAAAGFKGNNMVLTAVVSKNLVKNVEILKQAIELLMPCKGSILELTELPRIQIVLETDDVFFTSIATIGNDSSTRKGVHLCLQRQPIGFQVIVPPL